MKRSAIEHPGCRSLHDFSRRRMLLSTGALSATMLSPWTVVAEQMARERTDVSELGSLGQAKALIIVWLQGGPSQLETFDPHPNSKIGGDAKSISTTVKDLQIADSLPAVAEQMHLATLVRSMVSKEGDHERATSNFKTGWRPEPTLLHPSIGSVLAHMSEDNIDLPRHISILPGQWPARGGFLGPQYDAFTMYDPASPLPNLTSGIDAERRANRLKMMSDIADQEFKRGRIPDLDSMRLQQKTTTNRAVAMMDTTQLEAFDLTKEAKDVRDSFGDTAFGRGCLAAVRLVQQGVRCVEVELGGWDSHANNHNFQYARAKDLDGALASLLKLLEEREMLQNTIVLCSGEFGRTPSINPAGGRDHWPTGFSTLVAGGRFRRGYVHGATTSDVIDFEVKDNLDKVVNDPVTIPELHSTILHECGVDPAVETMTPIGRPMVWSEGKIRTELLT